MTHAGKNDRHNVNGLPVQERLQRYCESNRFEASHDALLGSFIFTGSELTCLYKK